MKVSIFAAALALGLSAGLAAAHAQEMSASPYPSQQLATAPSTGPSPAQTEQESYNAFKANTNPASSVGTTGPYDQEDLYVNREGFPLGGWSQVGEPQN
jgi:hypothetical protein